MVVDCQGFDEQNPVIFTEVLRDREVIWGAIRCVRFYMIWFHINTKRNLQLAMFAGDWINLTLRSIDRKGLCVKSLRICWIVGLIYDCQHATMYPQCFLMVFEMNTIETHQVVQKAVFYGQTLSASEQFMPPCRDTTTNTVGLAHVETRWWL